MNWDETDYIVAGFLVAIAGLLLYGASRLRGKYRWIAAAVIVLLFVATWAELAVGVFGTPFAGN